MHLVGGRDITSQCAVQLPQQPAPHQLLQDATYHYQRHGLELARHTASLQFRSRETAWQGNRLPL